MTTRDELEEQARDFLAGKDPLDRAMGELRQVMFDTWRIFREHAATPYGANEHERRRGSIQEIKEHLEFHPLEMFDSQHLAFLALLFAYWREMEVEANAPGPDREQ